MVEIKPKQNKLQIFIDIPLSYKKYMKNAFTISYILVGVSYQGWIGKCSKDETSHPAPLKVLFFSKMTTFHTSAKLCTTLKKKLGWGGICLIIFLGGVSMGV